MSGFERNLSKRLSESDHQASSRDRSKKGKNKSWESSDSDNNDFENYAQALEKDLGGSSSDDDFALKLEAHIGGSSSPKASANPLDLLIWKNTVAEVKSNTYSAKYSLTGEIKPVETSHRRVKPVEQLALKDYAMIEKLKQIDTEKCSLITTQCHILYKKFEKDTATSEMYYNMYNNSMYISRYAHKLKDKSQENRIIEKTKSLHSNLITYQEDFSKYINTEDLKHTNMSYSSLEDAKNAREYFIKHFKP